MLGKGSTPRRFPRWTNWGRNFSCRPAWFWEPADLDELLGVIHFARGAGLTIRPVGAGYSYTRLVQTDQVLVSLDRFTGIEHLDERTGVAIVRAGTRLGALTAALAKRGYALANLGDVDVQSIAGAIATGTHGTGLSLGNLSTQLVGLTLVTGDGDILDLDAERDPERFAAAQVALGALGIVIRVKLKVLPLYHLLVERWSSTFEQTLERLEEEVRTNRHFEFFWVPNSEVVIARRMNLAHGARTSRLPSPTRFVNEVLVENATLWLASELVPRRPAARPGILALGQSLLTKESHLRPAHQAFATPRWVRHQEMEYAIPIERTAMALRELEVALRRSAVRTIFPLEVRFVRRDHALLSPSYGRDVAYIAVHTYIDEDHRDYFDLCERIFLSQAGRPHWGKLHGLSARELRAAYPRWDDFQEIRAELDPEGHLRNPYLTRLFDVGTAAPSEVRTRSGSHRAEA